MSKLTVVVWNNQKAYFFRGTQYVRYDIDADKPDEGYPRTIDSGWPGLFKQDIDAAVVWPNGKAYFFKGDSYQRYDVENDSVDAGYPASIGGWGLPFGQATAATSADSEFRKRCTALLSKHEGHERHVYPDSLKIPSIGIG